jgi:hypothetical protein
MKRIISFCAVSAAAFMLLSCGSSGGDDAAPGPEISYPETSAQGKNILNDSFSAATLQKHIYSLSASLAAGASLKIRITGDPNGMWYFYTGTGVNWSITTFSSADITQEFTSEEGGTDCDLSFYFGKAGTYTIDYFENGSANPVKTRKITASEINNPIPSSGVSYPADSNNGKNLLNEAITTAMLQDGTYSLTACVASGSSVKIKITGAADGMWYFYPNTNVNWAVTTLENPASGQEFSSKEPGRECDLSFYFGKAGTYTFQYYEDGSAVPSATKSVTVQ